MRIVVAAFALALAGCSPQSGAVASDAPSANLVPLTITTANGQQRRYMVEVARTPEQQERGLMFRSEMARDHGMIFPMAPPRRATFWMKNTILPLDIIFIRADGTIARVAEHTVPYSLDMVDAGEAVGAVLELNAGVASADGIAAGDRVKWPG
jgi:uncharacterized membrane protein (UPF0127 family)